MKGGDKFAHLSVFGAWAFAFGCAVGWDVFVLPWTTFLPEAGPFCTFLGLVAGALVMVVIAWNFHYMIGKCPGPGGVYSYAKMAFGPDHGYICAWFLCLAYAAIVWADSAALASIVRYMAGGSSLMQALTFSVAGVEVFVGDMAVVALAMAVVVSLCLRGRVAAAAQTAFALMLVVGIAVCFAAAASRHAVGASALPRFSPVGWAPFLQFASILAMSPWLFVGFEAMSGMSDEFGFPHRKSFGVMVAAIAAAVAAYVAATLIPVFAGGGAPAGLPSALAEVGDANARAYDVVKGCVGGAGPVVLGATLLGALFTNLVGNAIVASRLVAAMADDGAMPAWLGRWNGKPSPRNGIICVAALSVAVSALGEAVIKVIVDMALVGAAIAYAYTSAAAFKTARAEGSRITAATGLVGLVSSVLLAVMFLFPALTSETVTMGTESFLVLVGWCVAGFVSFLFVFRRDGRNRFGHSAAVWMILFVVIIVLSHLWARQTARDAMMKTYGDLVDYHVSECLTPAGGGSDVARREEWHAALKEKLQTVRRVIVRNSYVQSGLDLAALAFLFAVYRILRRRELEMEREKARAKSFFFSTVSHDIRTPLNAIIAFSEMMKSGFKSEEERNQAVDAILVSGKTLLGLVNDVLDLSKLESGKMGILPEPTDCAALLKEVVEAFTAARRGSGVELRCRASGMPLLMVDPQRLRQVAFNLVGNSVKFTQEGHVEVRASFDPSECGTAGTLRIEVEDTGCGISEDDLKRIGSAYVQVGAKSSRNGGTGLGLAICKQLVAAMGGGITVASELGKGSTFTVTIRGVKVCGNVEVNSPTPSLPHSSTPPPASSPVRRRVLVVDDSKMNVLVLKSLLGQLGEFDIATAEDGQQALEMLRARDARRFDIVLTDMWMPRLDGAGLLKAIRSDPALAGMRVLAVTADVELQPNSSGRGFDGIILKPITRDKLASELAKAWS